MPTASIVIPCFNSERHLPETLYSAQNQSFIDLEIICVDNGSRDGTRAIIEDAASRDPRIRYVLEKEAGEGFARDAGLELASGDWLYFLDSDDIMRPQLIENSVSRGEDARADMVIFRTEYLDDVTQEIRVCPECFDIAWIQNWAEKLVFCPQQNPERIFNSFQNWVHNKLYRRSFIVSHGIRFQHLHRMADILFTCRSLAESERIALLDAPLHLYRTNNVTSALNTSDAYPLDFYDAFVELRKCLENDGTWGLYNISFSNWAEEAVAMNLYRSKSLKGFRTIVDTMQQGGINKLGIDCLSDEEVVNPVRHECCKAIAEQDLYEILFLYFQLEKRHLNTLEAELSRRQIEIGQLKSLRSYKLHSTLRRIRDRLAGHVATL